MTTTLLILSLSSPGLLPQAPPVREEVAQAPKILFVVEMRDRAPCPPACPCGRAETGHCDCQKSATKTKQTKKYCPCSAQCTCGCNEGAPCSCGDYPPGKAPSPSARKKAADDGGGDCCCSPYCTCGCQEGLGCICGEGPARTSVGRAIRLRGEGNQPPSPQTYYYYVPQSSSPPQQQQQQQPYYRMPSYAAPTYVGGGGGRRGGGGGGC